MPWLDNLHSQHHRPSADRPAYLFIDGGYLREGIDKLQQMLLTTQAPELSLNPFSDVFTKVFYYDASPVSDSHPKPADVADGQAFDELMQRFNRTRGCHVFVGKTTGRRKRQKQVDVQLAVDMLSHTLHGNMQSATLLAGDQDFLPVLDALKLAGMYTTLVYTRDSFSDDLVSAADESICLSWGDVLSSTDRAFQKDHAFPQVGGMSFTDLLNRHTTAAKIVVPGDLPSPGFEKKVALFNGRYHLDLTDAGLKHRTMNHTKLDVLCSCAAFEYPTAFTYNPPDNSQS